MKDFIELEFDKLVIVFVLLVILGLLYISKGDHDLLVFLMGVITTLIGSLTTLTKSNANTSKNAIVTESSKSSGSSTEGTTVNIK